MPEQKEQAALTEGVYYILLALYEPLHGYGIMQKVERLSRGRLRLAAGTLYGALSSLLERGWIAALQGGENARKKEYAVTAAGRAAVEGELGRLEELISNGRAITGGKQV